MGNFPEGSLQAGKSYRVTLVREGEASHITENHFTLKTRYGYKSMRLDEVKDVEELPAEPAGWPPRPGDVWRDKHGTEWFCFPDALFTMGSCKLISSDGQVIALSQDRGVREFALMRRAGVPVAPPSRDETPSPVAPESVDDIFRANREESLPWPPAAPALNEVLRRSLVHSELEKSLALLGEAVGLPYSNREVPASYIRRVERKLKEERLETISWASYMLLLKDLGELLEATGLGDHARPEPPHEVMQMAIARVRELKTAAGVTWSDYVVTEGQVFIGVQHEEDSPAHWSIHRGQTLDQLAQWLAEHEERL